jgi:hypothetical protein
MMLCAGRWISMAILGFALIGCGSGGKRADLVFREWRGTRDLGPGNHHRPT